MEKQGSSSLWYAHVGEPSELPACSVVTTPYLLISQYKQTGDVGLPFLMTFTQVQQLLLARTPAFIAADLRSAFFSQTR